MTLFKKSSKCLWLCLALLGILTSERALAWDGHVSGTIMRIDSLPNNGNFDLRIYLTDMPTICSAPGIIDSSWGYMNSSDPNYKGVMSVLLTAYAMGKSVTLYTTKGSGGYCQIGCVAMQ